MPTSPVLRLKQSVISRLLGSGIVRQHVKERVTAAFPHSVPMGEFGEDDVFLVGFPKSGNTWMQNLVAGVLYGILPEYAPGSLIQELVPDVHYKTHYQRHGHTICFKSHFLPRPEYRRVIYIIRDGRDALVSFWHYHKAVTGEEIHFDRLVEMPVYEFGTWPEHVTSWLRNPYGANMITVRYEDLKRDGAAELERVARFLGLERDREFLTSVVTSCGFQKLRSNEKLFGFGQTFWPGNRRFFRRGDVGSHLAEMPKSAIEKFEIRNGEILRTLGYL